MSREWAVVSELSGSILSIVKTGGSPPYTREGTKAVPLSNISDDKLKTYQYWMERLP